MQMTSSLRPRRWDRTDTLCPRGPQARPLLFLCSEDDNGVDHLVQSDELDANPLELVLRSRTTKAANDQVHAPHGDPRAGGQGQGATTEMQRTNRTPRMITPRRFAPGSEVVLSCNANNNARPV